MVLERLTPARAPASARSPTLAVGTRTTVFNKSSFYNQNCGVLKNKTTKELDEQPHTFRSSREFLGANFTLFRIAVTLVHWSLP